MIKTLLITLSFIFVSFTWIYLLHEEKDFLKLKIYSLFLIIAILSSPFIMYPFFLRLFFVSLFSFSIIYIGDFF